MNPDKHAGDTQSSLEKALDVCEALAGAKRGLSVTELARAVRHPPATVHRLLGVLKRRGFVRQDEDTARYSLTLKMLDLSFRLLGRSELRLHAYPVLREYVLRTGLRTFVAVPSGDEVTYLWQGVLLKDVLRKAGYDPSAKIVIFRCYDGYFTSLPLDFVVSKNVLLAYAQNGVVMAPERGFPFQVVAEDQVGYKWAKWVTGIEVSNDTRFRGYYERMGYDTSATFAPSPE